MTPWEWWAGSYGNVEYESAYELGGYDTREEATEAGRAEWPGEAFYVVEARTSTAKKYYEGDHEIIPFVKQRNQEFVDPDPAALLKRAIKLIENRSKFWVEAEQDIPPKKWWQFWKPDTRGIYDGMASELDIIADDMRDLL